MPNWVTNNVEVFHEDQAVIDEIFDTLTDLPEDGEENVDDRRVTFKKLVPPPPILENAQRRANGDVVMVSFDPEPAPGGRVRERPATPEELAEIEATGFASGYDWRDAKWGVKWDASHSHASKGDRSILLRFDTPWAPPEPVIDALRERWPEAEVCGGWIEEGYQSCGSY